MSYAVSLSPTWSTGRSKYDVNTLVEKQLYGCKRGPLDVAFTTNNIDTDDTSPHNTSPQHSDTVSNVSLVPADRVAILLNKSKRKVLLIRLPQRKKQRCAISKQVKKN